LLHIDVLLEDTMKKGSLDVHLMNFVVKESCDGKKKSQDYHPNPR
jgi:hypothetical protein